MMHAGRTWISLTDSVQEPVGVSITDTFKCRSCEFQVHVPNASFLAVLMQRL